MPSSFKIILAISEMKLNMKLPTDTAVESSVLKPSETILNSPVFTICSASEHYKH